MNIEKGLNESIYAAGEALKELSRVRHNNKLMKEALKEISLGAGRYSEDRLVHAQNTIEDMKEIAVNTLDKLNKNR